MNEIGAAIDQFVNDLVRSLKQNPVKTDKEVMMTVLLVTLIKSTILLNGEDKAKIMEDMAAFFPQFSADTLKVIRDFLGKLVELTKREEGVQKV